ncbi:hypothetical protein [Sphingobacterium sp. IITKGP-BTPF85]|uniref:hypothetical protein n=1 Tax=Sphingobacterium sp. IITKGP-BTPF85 TaxID=1338009 RepID=UPI00038A23E1|nr:hypothetical protein [Sphingobacterium sp. IITKGP-BTPF85]KKX48732.1 hypothetical protein L950_0219330 [Sphingobacterium sp. IITKGP-BTPF85]
MELPNMSVQERFNSLRLGLQIPIRESYIVVDCLDALRASLLQSIVNENSDLIIAPVFSSPKALFQYLQNNREHIILIEDEFFDKRIEYIQIVAGAVCATDIGVPWQVKYGLEKFDFTGKLIMISRHSKAKLVQKHKLMSILRDCIVI